MVDRVALRKKAQFLSGCLSALRTSNGRRRHPNDDDKFVLFDPFVSDEAKLDCSKARRTLAHKTQVFSYPEMALVRNRQSHVDEVVACSVIASELLGLNTNLVRAGALGHDIGHVPLGHQGEAWLAKQMGQAFCHEIMGVVIAQKIERRGRGLNLTHETLEAMMCHSGNTAREGMTPEAWLLRWTDKIAYLFHDFNDIGLRLGYPFPPELNGLVSNFGGDQRERTTTAIAGLVVESQEMGRVSFQESELGQLFSRFRILMYEVYPRVTQQDVSGILGPVFDWLDSLKIGDPCLLLALMTDDDIKYLSGQTMKDLAAFNRTAASAIVPYLHDIGSVNMCDPDLDW